MLTNAHAKVVISHHYYQGLILVTSNRIPQFQKRSTPLHVATLLGHRQVVKLLLRRGADVNLSSDCHEVGVTSTPTPTPTLTPPPYTQEFNSVSEIQFPRSAVTIAQLPDT